MYCENLEKETMFCAQVTHHLTPNLGCWRRLCGNLENFLTKDSSLLSWLESSDHGKVLLKSPQSTTSTAVYMVQGESIGFTASSVS